MKDFFVMTRRERRGMILLLVVIALALVAAVAARYHHEDILGDVNALEISQFEEEADSATIEVAKPESPQKSTSPSAKPLRRGMAKPKKPANPQKPANPKPADKPRPIEPVPAF